MNKIEIKPEEDILKFIDTIKSDLDNIESSRDLKREPIGQEVYTRELWQEIIINQGPLITFGETCVSDQTIFFDEDIIAAAKNFLLGPCGAWRDKALIAETRKFDSLEKLKENILNEAEKKDMVLYKTYTTEKVEFELETFKMKDRPRGTLYYWGGAFLDKE